MAGRTNPGTKTRTRSRAWLSDAAAILDEIEEFLNGAPWPNVALMLGMDKNASLNQQFFEFIRRYEQFPRQMEHRSNAPWQELVVDKGVNLFELLALFRLNLGDGGFYIDKACIVSRDLDESFVMRPPVTPSARIEKSGYRLSPGRASGPLRSRIFPAPGALTNEGLSSLRACWCRTTADKP